MSRGPQLPHRVVLLLALAVLINYVDRGNLATAAPLLKDELSLTNSEMGVLLSAFFWMYAPAQLLAGWLAHRFDVRIVLACGLVLWSVATVLTGFAGGFTAILLMRLLLGLGESVSFPCVSRLLAQHAPEHERGRANGLIGAGQALGPTFGTLFGGLLMADYGWRAVFITMGLVSLLWLWPWFAATRGGVINAPPGPVIASVSYLTILRQRAVWGASLGHFCANYAYYFVLSWLPMLLVKSRGFSVTQMAGIGAVVYGVHAVCTALIGAASDRWINRGASPNLVRKTFVLIGMLGAAATVACTANAGPRATVWLLLLTGVFFSFTTPMVFSIAQTLAGPRAAGRWAGVQNLSGQLAGVVAPIVTGVIIDRTGGQYFWAFAIAAAVLLLGAFAWGVIIPRVEPVRWPDELVPNPVAAPVS